MTQYRSQYNLITFMVFFSNTSNQISKISLSIKLQMRLVFYVRTYQ